MSDLATVTDLGTLRGQRRHAYDLTRPQRTPWAGPDLPVTWIDGTNVLPGGSSTFGDNPTTRKDGD